MSTPRSAPRPRKTAVGQLPAWGSRAILWAIGVLFLVPLASMLLFTLRQQDGGIGLDHWLALIDPENARAYRNLFRGIGNSLQLALFTVIIGWVLFLPTIVHVHLQFPKLTRALELLTIMPIAIPAIVLVVGFAPLYRVIVQVVGGGIWTLSLAYGVLVLPFFYRAIAADLQGMHARTLAEAARSLGAGWLTVLVRVIAPGLRRGIMSGTLITVAVVLGEYTVSSLLNRVTMQVAVLEISKSNPYAAVITSLLSLLVVFVLLFVFASLDTSRAGRAAAANGMAGKLRGSRARSKKGAA